MSRRDVWTVVLAALPGLLGVAAWLAYFALGWIPDSTVFLRVSLGYILLIAGLLISLIAFAFLALAMRMERRTRQAESRLQAEAASRHRQFLQRLDHELKNPLTALQLESANLEAALALAGLNSDPPERPVEGGSEQLQAAERVKAQVIRLNDLAVQLRKLAELETRPIEREQVALDEILSDLVAEFRAAPESAQRQIDLNLPQVPWPLPEVLGDADLLYLAARNVLGNAVKYTRPGDQIQVRAFEDSNWVTVEIADTGPGIPEDEQQQVWEELFRGKSARGTPGSGLGLAMVRTILDRHGGQVSLRSRLNRGTVVTLRIPLSS